MTTVNVSVYAVYLGIYLVITIGIGVYHARKIKTADDYLVAGRKIGFWNIVGSVVATSCGAAAFIGLVGMGYSSGINGIFFWLIPSTVFSVLLALVFGRILKRMDRYTIPDVFALRFGKNAAFVPSVFQIFVYSIPTLAIQFIGIGTIFSTFFSMDLKIGILIGFAVIFVPVFLGGMPATIISDTFQTIILTTGLFLLFFFGIHYAGGIGKIIEITPAHYWSISGKAGFGKFLSLALTIGPFYMVWQTTWQRIFSARNEAIAARGVTTGAVLICLILSFSFVIGIIARGYLPHDLPPDMVFTQAVSSVFPAAIGGLVVVGLAAALMSGADSFIMMGSVSVAKDIWQQYFNPGADETQMLKVSRWSVVIISLAGLAIAMIGKGIIPVYLLVIKIMGAGTVFPFLALMFWKRATRKGVLAGMAAGGLVTISWHVAGNPFVMQAVPGYLSCLIVMVIVSLMTSHAPDEQVKAAYFEELIEVRSGK